MIDNVNEDLKNKTILIVEDEDDVRHMNADILSLLVDRVIQSVDGVDGLRTFNQNSNIDLIILDINMPKMDGISMCKEIRTINQEVPIVFTTGYDEDEYKEELKYCKNINYLQKPIDSYNLLASIEKMLILPN